MIKLEYINKLRLIELYAKKIARGLLLGGNRSTSKGQGFDFDQIREYQEGDDVRSIDWNSSARMNKVLVKQFREEKTRTVLLALDISTSTHYGSGSISKAESAATMAGVIASVSSLYNDQVGLLLFSDTIEQYVPPAQGKKALRHILESIFSYQAKSKKTNIACALEHLQQVARKDSMIFLISDFIAGDFHKPLRQLAVRHDVIAICTIDQFEEQMVPCGFLNVRDSESGRDCLLDLRDEKRLNSFLNRRYTDMSVVFQRSGVDWMRISPTALLIEELTLFFKKRQLR